MSLTTRVTLLVTTVVAACFVVLAWMSVQATERVVQQSVSGQQVLLARKTLDQIDQFLYERYYDMNLISHTVQSVAILAHPTEETLRKDWIGNIAVASGAWQVMSLIDNQGLTIYSTNPKEIGEPIGDNPDNLRLFTKALDGLIVYSDDVISEENGHSTIIYAAPVWQRGIDSSQQIGVVLGHISWPVLEELLPVDQAHAVLVNRQGKVIAQNQVFETVDLMGKDLSQTDPVKDVLENGLEHTHSTMSFSGTYESLTSHVRENGHLDYAGNGWVMIFEVPTKVAFAEARVQAMKMLYVIGPVLVMGALVVVLLVIIYVVRPIIELNVAAMKLAQGDFSQRIVIHSHDEIEMLGDTFNMMAQQLGQALADLEQKVKDKTEALEKQIQESQQKNVELARMNQTMVGRELKMVELKQKLTQFEHDKDLV